MLKEHKPLMGPIASWLLFAIVALAPLPFGSVEPTVVAFWCIGLGICLVLAPIGPLKAGQLGLAALAALIVGAYAFVLHEQLAEHPWLATANPVWQEAGQALGGSLSPVVAIARGEPWFALGKTLLCILAITGGFVIGSDGRRARQLIKIIGWSGAAYAVYGIVSHVLDPDHILGRDKHFYIDSVTGTFINRNTAGAYFGSVAVVWSVLLWEQARLSMPRKGSKWSVMFTRLFSAPPRKAVVAFVMLFLCLAAMFMTLSRGAALVSLLSLTIGFVAFFWRDLPRRGGGIAVAIGAGIVALVLLELMGAGVNGRFDLEGLSEGGRLDTYRSAVHMIADHPWFGTGLGTFVQAFPAYRSPDASMWGVWDLAHNTLLEIATDMGVPIAVLVVIAWIVILAVLFRGIIIRRRGRPFPVAAFSVALLGILHSLIDFSLQIPGYAIVALTLVGAGLAQSFASNRDGTGIPSNVNPDLATTGQMVG